MMNNILHVKVSKVFQFKKKKCIYFGGVDAAYDSTMVIPYQASYFCGWVSITEALWFK